MNVNIVLLFCDIRSQETDILTDNLAKHLLNESEVLFETRDHRTLANLQESMVRECQMCPFKTTNSTATCRCKISYSHYELT